MLVKQIKKIRKKDEEVVKVVKGVKVRVLRGDKQKIEKELMLKEKKVYVPKDKELRLEVIQLYHDILVAKYRGKQKIMELVTRNYQWPEVIKNVGRYIERCDLCQRMKNKMKIPVGKLIANKILEKL